MIHVCEHHDALLTAWRAGEVRGIRLAHVDFHDDLRGLLLDRPRRIALVSGALARGEVPVDPGNFLAHAVLEERVASVRWVHDLPGGRAWDLGIVRYESDWLDRPRRWSAARRGGVERPLEFAEVLLENWNGAVPGEFLSVDWDCFASRLIPRSEVDRRVATFRARLGANVPPETWVAYSPDYCHETLDAFLTFVAELAGRFDQPVAWSSPGLREGRVAPPRFDTSLDRGVLARIALALRRRGFYA